MAKKLTGMWTPTDADLLRALLKRGTAMAQTLLGDLKVPRDRARNGEYDRNPIWFSGAAGKRMDALVKQGLATKRYQSYEITGKGTATATKEAK